MSVKIIAPVTAYIKTFRSPDEFTLFYSAHKAEMDAQSTQMLNKLFRDEGSYFSQLLRRCRHINFSFYILIHGWHGLRPHIKNEISTLFIFPCFNRQQLSYIYSQSASNLSTREFHDMYQRMQSCKNNNPDKHPYMIVDVVNGGNTWIEDN